MHVKAARIHEVRPPSPGRGFVLVLPGGGYQALSPSEGEPVCQWLANEDVPTGWLEYAVSPATYPIPLRQVFTAILRLRQSVDGPIALLGFSAGAHLAGLAATATDTELDVLESSVRSHARPDLAALSYPVTRLDRARIAAMADSALGGSSASPESLALARRASPTAPPFFIWHTAEDPVTPATDSIELASALLRSGVPVQLTVYPYGPHALSIGLVESVPLVSQWPISCLAWLRHHGIEGSPPGGPPPEQS